MIPDCKKESVSLVWANREAECGEWEILTSELGSETEMRAKRGKKHPAHHRGGSRLPHVNHVLVHHHVSCDAAHHRDVFPRARVTRRAPNLAVREVRDEGW
jgi:hypothetical protein